MTTRTKRDKSTTVRFALGARVQFRHALTRREQTMQHGGKQRYVECWLPPIFQRDDAPMQTGIVIGYRTKYDGYTEWIGSEEGTTFVQVGHRTVALVVTSLNTNPVCVDPSDLTLVLDTENFLNALVARVHTANAKWWVDIRDGVTRLNRNKGELISLIHSELSEALEGERKDLMDDKLPHRKMAEVEMADAVIRILDYCGGFNYDIGGAFEEKMAYNAVRTDHTHEARRIAGGKQF